MCLLKYCEETNEKWRSASRNPGKEKPPRQPEFEYIDIDFLIFLAAFLRYVPPVQANKASAAQSRVKMLAKMEANATPLPEGKSSFKAKMRLPIPPACHSRQVSPHAAFKERFQCQSAVAVSNQRWTVRLEDDMEGWCALISMSCHIASCHVMCGVRPGVYCWRRDERL